MDKKIINKIKKHLRTFQRELADRAIYNNMLCDMSEEAVYKDKKDIIEFRAISIYNEILGKENKYCTCKSPIHTAGTLFENEKLGKDLIICTLCKKEMKI